MNQLVAYNNKTEKLHKESIYFIFDQSEERIQAAHKFLIDFLEENRVSDVDYDGVYPVIDILVTKYEMKIVSTKLGMERAWV